jgi:hypothetical protein
VRLAEMLEGRPLFEGSGLDVIMRKHLNPQKTGLHGHPYRDVEATLRRALAQDPARRFPDLKSMTASLTLGGVADKTIVQPRQKNSLEGFVIPTDKLSKPAYQPITPVEMQPPTREQLEHPESSPEATLKFSKDTEAHKESLFKRLHKVISSGKPTFGLRLRAR